MTEQAVRQLHDVLAHHAEGEEDRLARFERAVELQALAVLLQVEGFGPAGTAIPIAEALAAKLKERGVLP